MPAALDPRTIITPDSFAVAPELLGRPLARPLRRGAAMLIDLALMGVFIAVMKGAAGAVLGVAAAVLAFRATARSGGGRLRRGARVVVRSAAALIFFFVVFQSWGFWNDERDDASNGTAHESGWVAGLSALGDLRSLRDAGTEAEAHAAARDLVLRLDASGLGSAELEEVRGELREALEDMPEEALGPRAATALSEALAEPPTPAAVERRIAALERRNRELREQLAAREARRGMLLAFVGSLADEFGIGFGWAGLYFTAFLVLWRGQTPGKRLLRLRVIRLDGRRIGWWSAFSRFGGYSACLATGLLGFLQIFWDRNRQGLHDKLVDTVVVKL